LATLTCVDCTKEYSEQLAACPNCHAPNPSRPPAPPPAAARQVTAAPVTGRSPVTSWIVVLSGGLITLGSIFPWITASAVFVGSISVNGMEGDGKITIVLGVILLVFGFVGVGGGKIHPVILILPGVAAIGVVIINYQNIQDAVREIQSSGVGVSSIGYGFWMIAIGGVVAVVGAVLSRN